MAAYCTALASRGLCFLRFADGAVDIGWVAGVSAASSETLDWARDVTNKIATETPTLFQGFSGVVSILPLPGSADRKAAYFHVLDTEGLSFVRFRSGDLELKFVPGKGPNDFWDASAVSHVALLSLDEVGARGAFPGLRNVKLAFP
jgi:hypothetical protein